MKHLGYSDVFDTQNLMVQNPSIILEEMNIVEFLEQLKHISLDGNQKENQLLSQGFNAKKSSGVSSPKVPFGQLKHLGKTKKKLTFLVEEEREENISTAMEDSLGPSSVPDSSKKTAKSLAFSISQAHQKLLNKRSMKQKGSLTFTVFPQNFEAQMKVMRSLR